MSRKVTNYRLFADFAYFIPGVKGMFTLLAFLLIGAVAGSTLSVLLVPLIGMSLASLVSYVIMFLPPLFYALFRSHENSVWGDGVALSSLKVKPLGLPLTALLVSVATFAAAFMTDGVISLLPEMPQWLKQALESATSGNLLVNLLMVSVFAPLLEEWLCRGEVLRGLLNHKRSDGSSMKPVWAIVISSAFFAVIHMNPWQAIPAFALGCLFGYVYYKTGSLWLTMLMHCVNNTVSVLLVHYSSFESTDSWVEALGGTTYSVLFVVCALILTFCILMLRRIPLERPEGNCTCIRKDEQYS